jgi:helix-turn-helix protein
MDDEKLEKIYPHKKGDIVSLTRFKDQSYNEWRIFKYLIGGYEVKNIFDGTLLKVETKEVYFSTVNLKKIKGHEKHDVIVSYVSNPDYDSFLYCRDCKKELQTEYKKLPKPKKVYFNKG